MQDNLICSNQYSAWSNICTVIRDVFVPSSVIILVIWALLIILFYRGFAGKPFQYWTSVILAFCVIGMTVGIFTGVSKSPVVGSILPAFLSVISAILIFIFGKEAAGEYHALVPVCIIALTLCTLFGAFYGSGVRGNWVRQQVGIEKEMLEYREVIIPSMLYNAKKEIDEQFLNKKLSIYHYTIGP